MPSRKTRSIRDALVIAVLPGTMLIVVHLFLILSGLYWEHWWLDNPMHLAGGAVVAWASWVLFIHARRRRILPKLPLWFVVFALLGAVALVGVFWEFYEFLSDVLHGSGLQGGIDDTMKDFANDLLGGLALVLMLVRRSDTI